MIKDMEQGIESRIRVTVKDTRSKFQDFSLKTFLSRYFDRLTGEARPGWVCGWSQASPCQELDWQGVRSFQPSEFYRDRSFLGKDNYFCCRILSFQEELLRISYHFLFDLKLSKKLCWQQWPAWNIGNEFHLQTVRASILPPNSKWGVIKCKTAWGGRIWIIATWYQSQCLQACPVSMQLNRWQAKPVPEITLSPFAMLLVCRDEGFQRQFTFSTSSWEWSFRICYWHQNKCADSVKGVKLSGLGWEGEDPSMKRRQTTLAGPRG